jgi:pilus assembly protein CpaF
MVSPELVDELLATAAEQLAAYRDRGRLDLQSEAEVRDILLAAAGGLARRTAIEWDERQELVQTARDELFGLGVFQPWADATGVTDIVVTGPHEAWVRRGGEWIPLDPGFRTDDELLAWGRRFAERHKRHVDHASPWAAFDFDGGRFHIIIPPAAGKNAQFSIRVLHLVGELLDDLVGLKTLTWEASDLLMAVVRAKLNVIVSGGAGSGKTTMANALGRAIPEDERVVTIEDLAELQLARHLTKCTALYTQPANSEGRGQITTRQLIPQALRMCADRVIVGEVLREEAGDLLDVMNTGHEGSLTSIHSNSAGEALSRLVTLLGLDGWPQDVAARQVGSTIALVVHMRKLPDGRRVVETITDVDGVERTGVIRTSHIFERVGEELHFVGMPRADRAERLLHAGWQAPQVQPQFEPARRSW